MNVMILGAGGGIGRALLEEYSSSPDVSCIYATHHRDVSSVTPLIRWLRADMSDPASIMALAEQVDQPIHRWISCTGILASDHGQPEKTLRQLSSSKLQFDYQVNALGPLTAFSALANQLRSGDVRAVFLSAQVGSIEDNRLGGWYGYRMSKAALNAAGKSMAHDLKSRGVAVAILHPGLVSTAMINFNGQVSAEYAAAQLAERIETLNLKNTGTFWHANGDELPW